MPKCRIKVGVVSAMLLCWSAAIGQGQNSAPQPVAKAGTEAVPYTFKAATRLVVVDVVAKDAHNQPVRDLTEADFRVFEKQGSLEESPQKISAFRFVDGAAPRPPIETAVTPVPHGTYTNLVATHDLPVPPTVLLIDALNTALSSGNIEIRQRLLRMTDSIPGNVPVAVFLLGAQPQMVQNFTTDSKALHRAVARALGLQLILSNSPIVRT
jgi:VWFA-related protein